MCQLVTHLVVRIYADSDSTVSRNPAVSGVKAEVEVGVRTGSASEGIEIASFCFSHAYQSSQVRERRRRVLLQQRRVEECG